jgi:hypothetical protein
VHAPGPALDAPPNGLHMYPSRHSAVDMHDLIHFPELIVMILIPLMQTPPAPQSSFTAHDSLQ